MWRDNKRLLVLMGLGAALLVYLLFANVIPWLTSEDEETRAAEELTSLLEEDGDGDDEPTPPPPGAAKADERGGGNRYIASSSADPGRVLTRVTKISRRPKRDHLPVLKKAARHESPKVREAAVTGIGRLGEDSDPRTLIEALRSDESGEVRAAAAAALGKLKHWDAGETLMDALSDEDPRVRARAGAALQQIMGADFHYRAKDPQRDKVIQRIRKWWPKYYENRNAQRS